MCGLVRACPPLDVNSVYAYLLLAEHFPETCVLAEDDEGLSGLVTGYLPQARSDTLFVWQVAVAGRARGLGLGCRMLRALVERPQLSRVRYIETTVGPDNQASRRMFARLARGLRASTAESAFFDAAMFGAGNHGAEPLLRIGPFEMPAAAGGVGESPAR